MRVFFINAVCGVGSTGKIITDLCDILKNEGNQVMVAYGVGKSSRISEEDTVCISNKVDYYIHNAISKINDRAGFYSILATKKLIKSIKMFKPDVIHIHNIHGYYVNIKMLFEFLAVADIPVVWTLHDCWSFTGHCAHFSHAKCYKWKSGCFKCPLLRTYPVSFLLDNSKKNYYDKKKLFTDIKNMTIVTPSDWLRDLAKLSYLKKYDIMTINNGIDLNMFKYTKSNIFDEYKEKGKKIILAVANVWSDEKGLKDMFYLNQIIDKSRYVIAMVGLSNTQISKCPNDIIKFTRTRNIEELVKIYSNADVFVNPTIEEVFGMVNIEALACGTPVITYKTGGSPETIDNGCGIIVEQGNVNEMYKAIEKVLSSDTYSKTNCVKRSKLFDKNKRYNDYIELYNKVLSK